MLRLRPYKACDAEKIVTWIGDEFAFRQWCSDRYDHYPITAADMNAQYDSLAFEDWFYPMTAFDSTGPVGHLIMRFTDPEKKTLRFGFVIIDAAQRGQGYGREMLSLALKMAFEILKAEIVTLGVFENNPRAHRCYLTAGFRDLPDAPRSVHLLDEDWPCREMELTAEDYRSCQTKLPCDC